MFWLFQVLMYPAAFLLGVLMRLAEERTIKSYRIAVVKEGELIPDDR